MRKGITILGLVALMLMLAPTRYTLAQDDTVCETDVVVQADDWLSKIADKFLGDVLAFTAIAEATNAKAQSDNSYATIEDVNNIEAGWKLCIPSAEQAQAALTSQQQASPLGKELPADAAEEQVIRLVAGSTGDSGGFTFNPLLGGGAQQVWLTLQWMPPLYFDVNQNLRPGVFATWESSPDYKVWIFHIDPRARWSDDTPITTNDVKTTWEVMADPLSQHGRIVQYIGNVAGFEEVRSQSTTDMTGLKAVDERTLEVTLTKPDPIFHWRIATAHMVPVKAEQVKASLDFWRPENKPVVSGPYMIETFDPDLGTATMVPNPNWWLDVGPFLDQITFEFVEDSQTLAVMAQNNQVDGNADVALPQAVRNQVPDWFRPVKEIGFNSFWFAVTVEPTNDPKVREALTLAVNFEDVLKAAYPEGGAEVPTQMLDPNVSCYDTENSWYTYDPEAAKAALASSSYGGPENLPKIRVTPRSTDAVLVRALEAVMEFWRQNLGITNIEFKNRPEEFGEEDALQVNLSRDDVVIRFPDGATYAYVASHSAGPIANDVLRGYQNPELDALIEQALGLPPDDPSRCGLVQEAQKLFMADYPGLFFAYPTPVIRASDRVKNYERGPDWSLIEPWRIYLGQ